MHWTDDDHYIADEYAIYEGTSTMAYRYSEVRMILNNFVDAYMLPEPLPLPVEDAVEFLTDLCKVMNIPYRRLSFKVDSHG